MLTLSIIIFLLYLFTAQCTLVQSAVLRSHVVRLSVCDVGGLWSHLNTGTSNDKICRKVFERLTLTTTKLKIYCRFIQQKHFKNRFNGVLYEITTLDVLLFRPGNGSPSAANVVVVLLLNFIILLLVISAKAFSFHDRSPSNFARRLVTTLSTVAPCRIFKLSPKLPYALVSSNSNSDGAYTAALTGRVRIN